MLSFISEVPADFAVSRLCIGKNMFRVCILPSIGTSLSLLLQLSLRLHQFGICEVSDGHLGVFSVSGCLWHRSPMKWVLNRHKNILLQLLHSIKGFLLQCNYSPWHFILSGAIKQAHWSAMGNFLGDPRPGEWFSPQTALQPGVALRIWLQFGSRTFQITCYCLSAADARWFKAVHGVLAKVGVLSLEMHSVDVIRNNRICFSGHWAADPLEG